MNEANQTPIKKERRRLYGATAKQEQNAEVCSENQNSVDSIITKYAFMAEGIALQPVVLLRNVGFLKLQLKMLSELADCFEVTYSEYSGQLLILTLIGNMRSQHKERHGFSALYRLVSGLGLLAETFTFPINPRAVTFAVGKVFQRHFAQGGNLLNFSTTEFEEYFAESFAEAVSAS